MKKIYYVAINWQKAQHEKPNTTERLKFVKLYGTNEGNDIAQWLSYFSDYDNGWRIYSFTTLKHASELFNKTMAR